MVCFENHAEWRICLFSVQWQAPVETGLSVSRDRRTSCAVLRVVAQLAQCALLERGLLCSSVVSSISVTVQWTCCVTHMTRTPQRLKKIALVITAQFISLRSVPNFNVAVNCSPFLQYVPHDDSVEILPYAVLWVHWLPRYTQVLI